MDGILAQQRVFCCKFIRNFLFSSSSSIFLSLKLLWDSLWCCQGFKDPQRKLLNSFEAFECELCARHIHSELEFTEGVQNCYGMKFADFSQVWNAFSVCFKILPHKQQRAKASIWFFHLASVRVLLFIVQTHTRESGSVNFPFLPCARSLVSLLICFSVENFLFLFGRVGESFAGKWWALCRLEKSLCPIYGIRTCRGKSNSHN